MSNASKTYPLSFEEQRALMRNVLISDGILAFFGIVFATFAMSIRTGDWMADFFGSKWLPLSDMGVEPHWAMIVLPVALCVFMYAFDRIAKPRSETYRAELTATRQGVNGELPRLPLPYRAAMCIYAGFTEEVAFRYGLLGFLVAVSQVFVPGVLSLAAAIILASAVFALLHAQYTSPWTIGIVFGIGIVFSIVWIATNNLLIVIVAHALYDFIDMAIERHHMVHEPDYFEGNVPNNLLAKILEDREPARKSDSADESSAQSGETPHLTLTVEETPKVADANPDPAAPADPADDANLAVDTAPNAPVKANETPNNTHGE